MFKKTTFKNGLRMIAVPSKSAETVTVLVLAGTGSKYETKEISGISHFLEHLQLKGTKKHPTEMEIFTMLDEWGGVWNAFTGPEYTGYYAKVQSGKFEKALGLVSDIYLNATLPAPEIEKERGTIIEEINMFHDHPMRHIWTVWGEVLYGDQPAGWDIAGTKETVRNISRDQLMAYRNAQYTASNTIVCLSGNFSEAKAKRLVQKYFAATRTNIAKTKPAVTESQSKPEVLIYKKDTNQTQVAIGVRAFNNRYKKRFALEILSVILGGMTSSRLMEEVRIKRGLTYDVHTELTMDSDVGSLAATANLDSSRLDEGIKVILGEFKKIAKHGITAVELKKAKDNYIGKLSIALESSHAQASFYADQEIVEEKILDPGQIRAKILRVTEADVWEVAREIFKPEKLNLALIGPYDDKSRFQKLLDNAL